MSSLTDAIGKTTIIQYNTLKQQFVHLCINSIAKKVSSNIERFHILHDASGGNGVELSRIPSSPWENFTGYSGGINPENCVKMVENIEQAIGFNRPYYIDMESGIRTNNQFDLTKCKAVYKNIREYYDERKV
jgi:phosphoribosylanthranilate isomerase